MSFIFDFFYDISVVDYSRYQFKDWFLYIIKDICLLVKLIVFLKKNLNIFDIINKNVLLSKYSV